MPKKTEARGNLSSPARVQRQRWRTSQRQRAHKTLYDASDYIKTGVVVDIDASHFAKMWIGVGLQIAAEVIEQMANELLVEDIVKGKES